MSKRRFVVYLGLLLLCSGRPISAEQDWLEKPPSGWIRSFPSENQIPTVSDYPASGAVYLLDEDIFYVADKTEVRVVIMKILNRRGHAYAEVTTPYYRQDESIEVRGRTRRNDGTVMELRQEDVHEISASDDMRRKKFSLPGVEDGCLIHYEIVYRAKKYTLSGIRYFQGEEPTILSRFNLIVPNHLRVIYYDSPPGILDTVKQIPLHSESVSLYTFAKRDLLAREAEPLMPPSFEYLPGLAFTIAASDQEAELQASWANTSRWYFETMERHFVPTKQMKKLAKEIVKDIPGEKEKTEKIFHFVQSHFKAGFASRSIFDLPQTIFNRQVGSSAEVAGILYALLKSVGIEATPVLVPDREMVMRIPDVPMLDWFRHVLLRVNLEGEELWLDPYYETNGVDCISEPYRNVDGLLIQETDGELVRTPSLHYAENLKVNVTQLKLATDGSIQCESRKVYAPARSGKIKNTLRSRTVLERRDNLARELCQYCPGAVLDSCHFGDLFNYDEEFEIYYRFGSSHCLQEVDSFLYLNPKLVNRDIIAKDFSEPVRIYPIMFDEQKTDVDQVTIELPPAYQVTDLPAPLHLEEDFGEFRAEYKMENGSVSYKRTLTIMELLVPASSYKQVKSFFNGIFEQDQKVITIKRQG